MNQLIVYQNTGDFVDDVCHIIDDSQKLTFRSVNAMHLWYLGTGFLARESPRKNYAGQIEQNIGHILYQILQRCLLENMEKDLINEFYTNISVFTNIFLKLCCQ